MKKIIAIVVSLFMVVSMTGCASGPDQGHYETDANGQTHYVPSASAQNADTWDTVGVVALGAAALAGLTLGITNATK